MSQGEEVTPHWLLGGRSRRAVSLDDTVRTWMEDMDGFCPPHCMVGLCDARVHVLERPIYGIHEFGDETGGFNRGLIKYWAAGSQAGTD